MPRAYSDDLRKRAVAMMEAGATAHQTAFLFDVAISSVVKWRQRLRETGSVSAKPVGRRPVLLERHRDFIAQQMKATPHLTVRQLQEILKKRGVRISHDAVWRFLHKQGLSFKKNTVRP